MDTEDSMINFVVNFFRFSQLTWHCMDIVIYTGIILAQNVIRGNIPQPKRIRNYTFSIINFILFEIFLSLSQFQCQR